MEKKDSRSDHVEPFNALLALLVVWMVAGAWLCLENTAGIPTRLAYALVGIVIMVLMCRTASKRPLPEVKKLDVPMVGEDERAEREHAAELAAQERAAELARSKVAKAQRKAGLRCPSCGSCDVTLIRDTGRTLSVGKPPSAPSLRAPRAPSSARPWARRASGNISAIAVAGGIGSGRRRRGAHCD